MKNILVTGGAGFIGSNFIRNILSRNLDINVYNLDVLTYAGNLDNLIDLPNSSNYNFIHGNILDQALISDILKNSHIDTVVHFAAETHVDRSIDSPYLFIETNVLGTFFLLEAIRETDSNIRLHHISTDEVFGTLSANDSPWNESAPYNPQSPYSASKASADHMVRSYGHTYGIKYTISNCSNNYGEYQFPEKLIPLTILNAMDGKRLPVYGDGLQIRDWVHVGDHCDAVFLILENGVVGESYNIGGRNQPTNISIVKRICSILDILCAKSYPHENLIKFVTDRAGHDRRYAMDCSKIETFLGWKPSIAIDDGLFQTVEWYIANDNWIKNIKERRGA